MDEEGAFRPDQVKGTLALRQGAHVPQGNLNLPGNTRGLGAALQLVQVGLMVIHRQNRSLRVPGQRDGLTAVATAEVQDPGRARHGPFRACGLAARSMFSALMVDASSPGPSRGSDASKIS